MTRSFNHCTFMLMGVSGCGKNAMAEMLIKRLKESGSGIVKYFESGAELRRLAESGFAVSASVKKTIDAGDLAPDPVIGLVVDEFVNNLKHQEIAIFDGFPRTLNQSNFLDELFYMKDRMVPIVVIHIKLPFDTAVARIKKRAKTDNRGDDAETTVKRRFAWFQKDVLPVIDYYKSNDSYYVIEVDGEGSKEEVFNSIMSELAKVPEVISIS